MVCFVDSGYRGASVGVCVVGGGTGVGAGVLVVGGGGLKSGYQQTY